MTVHVRITASAFPYRPPASIRQKGIMGSHGSRSKGFHTCSGSQTAWGSAMTRHYAMTNVAFRLCDNVSTPDYQFRRSISGLRVPLSTLRRQSRDCQRMTRGQCGLANPSLWGSCHPYLLTVYAVALCGRDCPFGQPPAQIPASGIPAQGSSRGCLAQKR
jgi:hypothetical protein